MDRSLLVVAVALLAVTAGCGGFGGQSATTVEETTRDAATTEPATTAEPTQTQPAIAAPGFNQGRLVDPLALADAHRQLLAGSPFARHSERVTREDGNTTAESTTLRVENESQWLVERAFDGVQFLNATDGSIQQYAEGDTVYYRTDRANGNVTYGVTANPWSEEATTDAPPALKSRFARDYVYAVFTTASWTTIVGENTADGETVYRVLGNASGDTTFRGERVSNFEVEADVTADGVVQYMVVNYDRNGTAVTRTLSFSDVGETAVERPEWYDTALNRTDDSDSEPN